MNTDKPDKPDDPAVSKQTGGLGRGTVSHQSLRNNGKSRLLIRVNKLRGKYCLEINLQQAQAYFVEFVSRKLLVSGELHRH